MTHTKEPPSMQRGQITYTGRFPGYEPSQAMRAFFSASVQHDRPSYEERRDVWVSDGPGYALVVGCFVETDGTPVIAWTCVSESDGSHPSWGIFMGEVFSVLNQSAESIRAVPGDEEITESGEYGALRQLRPGEIHTSTPTRMKEAFIWHALNQLYPGQWGEFWPDVAASFVSEGEGVIVTYNNDRFQVASIVLSDLRISAELIQGVWEANTGLPIGSVVLSGTQTGWCAIWKYKLLVDWLDPVSAVSRKMALDILTNAPNMTQMARQTLQAKQCGGNSTHPVDPESGYAILTMSHV